MLRKKEGITLIALVITIIVLLILAGITLALVAAAERAVPAEAGKLRGGFEPPGLGEGPPPLRRGPAPAHRGPAERGAGRHPGKI